MQPAAISIARNNGVIAVIQALFVWEGSVALPHLPTSSVTWRRGRQWPLLWYQYVTNMTNDIYNARNP